MDKAFITVTPDTGQNNGTLSVNADKMRIMLVDMLHLRLRGGVLLKLLK